MAQAAQYSGYAKDNDFHQYCRERESHAAIGFANLFGKDFGVVGNAPRRQHDGTDQESSSCK
ncbi:hypothetical protein [Duganella sp. Root336D2]|uniref:hypothetical protein n=1 Tax=Duganella sp. Root336D2 TaxID=1736518 RepID=UPI0006F8B95C|nr:hypothetical protein [Duganella sp. Root336D2]KQV61559.1 hypothetical protein ASD07_01530 [Duganella sp. Root336D2]